MVGDFPVDQKVINGEVFSTVAMAYLIGGQYEKIEGPLGETFIQAIRLRWSAQLGETATIEEISEHFQQYDISQLEGVSNTIKGKMFEILVTDQENTDSDNWTAKMHEDGSRINFDTGVSEINCLTLFRFFLSHSQECLTLNQT